MLKKVQEKQQAKEVKYSIETDGPYSYVKADRQVFTSSNIDTRKVQLENYLNSIINYTGRLEIPTMDGEVIAITDASTGRTNSVGKLSSYNEYVNSETGEANLKKIRLKQNIALHIDEVIEVSRRGKSAATQDANFKHDAASQKGWTYRNAAFEDFDGKRYAFLISVPENDTGKFVYNVNKFKERAVKTKRPSSEKITGLSLSGAQTEESLNSYYAQNKESVKGKFSLDEAYRKAVTTGNVQEQQKLVEQAAKEAGYTKLFYHGSKKGGGFTTFKNWQYFTENKQYAQRYAGGENGLYTTYVKMENPFDTRQAEARSLFNEARQELGLGKLQENGLPDWTDGYDLSEYIEENDLPYDSIILDEGGDMVNGKPVSRGLSYVIRNPEQIKSADAVTYDDAGNAIPLSERFNMGKKDIRYSLDTDHYDYSRSFAQQIDDYVAGKFPERDTFVLGKTPDIFQKVGLSALPMTMDQVHVDYALNGTKDADHLMGADLLKKLPSLLEKPVAIIESATHPDNSVVAIVKGEVNGKQVTAAVRVGGRGRQNGVDIDSNHVASVQGRNNAITKLLADAVRKELNGETGIYYWNKNEALPLTVGSGLQLPGSHISDGLIHSIFDAGSPVNRKKVLPRHCKLMRKNEGLLLQNIFYNKCRSQEAMSIRDFPWADGIRE